MRPLFSLFSRCAAAPISRSTAADPYLPLSPAQPPHHPHASPHHRTEFAAQRRRPRIWAMIELIREEVVDEPPVAEPGQSGKRSSTWGGSGMGRRSSRGGGGGRRSRRCPGRRDAQHRSFLILSFLLLFRWMHLLHNSSAAACSRTRLIILVAL